MSIIPNCLEYLLGVAEKIIDAYADINTTQKYYALKQNLTKKTQILRESNLSRRSHLNNQSQSSIRKSVGIQKAKNSKRQVSRQSFTKSKQISNSESTLRPRIKTFASQPKSPKEQKDQCDDMTILTQLSTILKNSQLCPQLLKTVTIPVNTNYERFASILADIQQSLRTIYIRITESSQESNSNEPELPFEELLADNKWLLNKLQILIGQNSTLRRMVGSVI